MTKTDELVSVPFECGNCGGELHEFANREEWPDERCGELFDQRYASARWREDHPEEAKEQSRQAKLRHDFAVGHVLPLVVRNRETGQCYKLPAGSFDSLVEVEGQIPWPARFIKLPQGKGFDDVAELVALYSGPSPIVKGNGTYPHRRGRFNDRQFEILGVLPWITWWWDEAVVGAIETLVVERVPPMSDRYYPEYRLPEPLPPADWKSMMLRVHMDRHNSGFYRRYGDDHQPQRGRQPHMWDPASHLHGNLMLHMDQYWPQYCSNDSTGTVQDSTGNIWRDAVDSREVRAPR